MVAERSHLNLVQLQVKARISKYLVILTFVMAESKVVTHFMCQYYIRANDASIIPLGK